MSNGFSPRFLGIDYGARRIGVAVSDPLNIIARGLATIDNRTDAIDKIARLVAEYAIGTIVVGMPLQLSGEAGHKAREVEEFVSRLAAAVTVDIVTFDERFTTSIAHATNREMGVRKKKRESRQFIDEMAASLLLQGYLDAHRTR